MKTPKCYTWLESCGSHLSGGVKEKIFFCILQSVRFSMTVCTDIFLYTEKLSYLTSQLKFENSEWLDRCMRMLEMLHNIASKSKIIPPFAPQFCVFDQLFQLGVSGRNKLFTRLRHNQIVHFRLDSVLYLLNLPCTFLETDAFLFQILSNLWFTNSCDE